MSESLMIAVGMCGVVMLAAIAVLAARIAMCFYGVKDGRARIALTFLSSALCILAVESIILGVARLLNPAWLLWIRIVYIIPHGAILTCLSWIVIALRRGDEVNICDGEANSNNALGGNDKC